MFCPKCGSPNADSAATCVRCGAPIQPPAPRPDSLGDDPGMRLLLPVGRSGFAIAAGYAGLLSFFPLFGPFALVLGSLAIWHLKRNPKVHGMGRAVFGLVMGILGTLLLVFLVVGIVVGGW